MRVVAKVQFTSEGSSRRAAAAAAIEHWAVGKYSRRADGSLTITRSGAQALFERVDQQAGDYGRTHFSMLEPVDGGSLQTD